MMNQVELTHTVASDLVLSTLRGPEPHGYNAKTWGSCFRLLYVYATNPGKQGCRRIRSKPGWAWECLKCKREVMGEENKRPGNCPFCKSRYLKGNETSVFFLTPPGSGGEYAGGIELAEFAADWSRWCLMVAPDPRAFRAAECWARGLGSERQADFATCSPRYAWLSIRALSNAYDLRKIGG